MKLLALASVLCLSAAAADTNIVLTTAFEDGSTNTWTQSELVDALGLMNRKYHRDMGSEAGRQAWHGRRLQQYLMTNGVGRIYMVSLYADGYTYTDGGRTVRTADPEAAAKAKAEAAARAEAIKAAWEAAHLPPEIAALRAAQRAAESGVTNTVTVIVEP